MTLETLAVSIPTLSKFQQRRSVLAAIGWNGEPKFDVISFKEAEDGQIVLILREKK